MLNHRVTGYQGIVGIVLVRQLGGDLHDGVGRYVDLSLTLGTTLRGDQDHTVSTLHTVDSRGRGILQHGDGGYRLDIDTRHRTLDTVHQHQRLGVVPRRGTTDLDLRFLFTRQTLGGCCDHTRQVTRQGGTDVGDTCGTLQHLTCGLRDGTHHRGFLLLAETYDNHFRELGIVTQRHVECALLAHLELTGVHSHIRDDDGRRLGWDTQGEITVKVRHRTYRGISFNHNGGSYQGLSVRVDNCSLDGNALSPRRSAHQEHQRQCRPAALPICPW